MHTLSEAQVACVAMKQGYISRHSQSETVKIKGVHKTNQFTSNYDLYQRLLTHNLVTLRSGKPLSRNGVLYLFGCLSGSVELGIVFNYNRFLIRSHHNEQSKRKNDKNSTTLRELQKSHLIIWSNFRRVNHL